MKLINSNYKKFLSDYLLLSKYEALNGPFTRLDRRVNIWRVLYSLMCSRSLRFCLFLRLGQSIRSSWCLGTVYEVFFCHLYASDISLKAEFGPAIYFPHPFGIVIGSRSKIRGYTVIFHDVTLGKLRPGFPGEMPRIGFMNVLSAGCRVLGAVKTGHKVVIAANCILTKGVGSRSTVIFYNLVKRGSYFS